MTAPCVVARDQDGRLHHVYEGGVIQWLSDEQAKHFLDSGLVEGTDKGVGGSEPVDEPGEVDADDDAPAKSAAKSEWVDYAVSKGYDRDEVEAMTKTDIQALDFADEG